jgi:Rad3-related DNA helicase
LDECHLLEQNITSWAGLRLSLADIRNKYDLIGGELIDSVMLGSLAKGTGYKCHKNFIDFLWNKLRIKLENEMIELESLNKKDRLDLSVIELNNLSKLEKSIESLTWLKMKLNIFIKSKDKDSWIIEPTDDEKMLIMEPIKVGNLFNQFINYWGIKNVIFMSATILDIRGFCKELEINKEDVGIIKMESSFSPDKSPIFFNPCGSMSQKNINGTLPNIINEVKKIIGRYPNSKGIIHTGNYKITKAIIDAIHSDRFIYKSGTESNEDLIKKHERNLNPTILVSPSMHTGVDLKDDLSRFQIIAKVPFPNLGDKYISIKKDAVPNWYSYQTAKAIVQSYGRSVRSEDDYACTYILDSDFGWVLKYNNNMFPKYFK